MKKELKLTDILVTIVIAIAFGIVYILWGTVYYAVQPLGLHLDQLLYGMWFIAGTVGQPGNRLERPLRVSWFS